MIKNKLQSFNCFGNEGNKNKKQVIQKQFIRQFNHCTYELKKYELLLFHIYYIPIIL